MRIFVDELPKCCLECQLECPYEDRCVDTITMNCSECIGRPKDCPLHSLADYTKQVRKEVLDIIEEKFNCCGYVEEKFEDIKKYVLDQIEQGESKCLN